MSRKCKCGCGSSINHKHKNAKFLNQKHKDSYHNWNNPRGKFSHLSDYDCDDYDPGDSEYWDRKEY
jgi:hypothetical protein